MASFPSAEGSEWNQAAFRRIARFSGSRSRCSAQTWRAAARAVSGPMM